MTDSRRFAYSPAGADPERTVYVDGTEAGFRSLSHWPGNTTPGPLKRDLSTGIALAWAEMAPAERLALTGPFDVVANNHYDTDGVLSVFTVLRPEEALPRAERMLAAAATGDFATWNGPDALAVELTVMRVIHHAASPLAARLAQGPNDAERHELGYLWLIDEIPALLDDPYRLRSMWDERHRRIVEDVARVERRDGLSVEDLPELDLAVITANIELTAIGCHHAAGERTRVLLVMPGDDGTRFRFLYRDESWFDLVTRRPPPRVPLGPLVDALSVRETAVRPPPRDVCWWSTALEAPVVQLGFSDPSTRTDGFFHDPSLGEDPPSALSPSTVVDLLCDVLQKGRSPGETPASSVGGGASSGGGGSSAQPPDGSAG